MDDPAKMWNLYQVYLIEKDAKDPDLTFEDFKTIFLLSNQQVDQFTYIAIDAVMEKYDGYGNSRPGRHRKLGEGESGSQ